MRADLNRAFKLRRPGRLDLSVVEVECAVGWIGVVARHDKLCDLDGPESDLTFKDIGELEAYRDEWVAKYEAKNKKRAAKKARKKKKAKARRR